MIIKIEKFGGNIFKINNDYYAIIPDNACLSCDLYESSTCINGNTTPMDCLSILGSNKYNKKCFKKLDKLLKKGGI